MYIVLSHTFIPCDYPTSCLIKCQKGINSSKADFLKAQTLNASDLISNIVNTFSAHQSQFSLMDKSKFKKVWVIYNFYIFENQKCMLYLLYFKKRRPRISGN